jgi:hypothetical protein
MLRLLIGLVSMDSPWHAEKVLMLDTVGESAKVVGRRAIAR